MNRAVFFDRDGVVNDVLFDNKKNPLSPTTIEEYVLKDGIRELVKKVKNLGYKTIVITNQPYISRNLISQEFLNEIHGYVKKKLSLDDLIFCPHDNDDNCACRKPKPGMLIEMSEKHDIDLNNSYMVGDTYKDVGAGESAGCKTIIVDAHYNQGVEADYRVKKLGEIERIITQ